MNKALIIRLSSLGDVVLASVVIDPLLEAGFKPYLLTFRPYDSIFEDDWRVTTVPAKRESIIKKDFIEQLKNMNFDLFIDLHKNFRTVFLRTRLGGKWLSYRKDSLRRRLSVRLPFLRKSYYVTQSYLSALKGLASNKSSPLPRIEVSEERLQKVSEFLPSTEFVAIAPGARYIKKRYPYYSAVARLLKEAGVEVVWVGDEKDRALVPPEVGINLCGELSLTDLLAVLKLASALVGNDSGPLHLARSVGTRCVQVYGGTHPTLGFSLFPEEGEVILRNLPCQPCDIHGKGNCRYGDYRCLEIPPEAVSEKTLSLIRNN